MDRIQRELEHVRNVEKLRLAVHILIFGVSSYILCLIILFKIFLKKLNIGKKQDKNELSYENNDKLIEDTDGEMDDMTRKPNYKWSSNLPHIRTKNNYMEDYERILSIEKSKYNGLEQDSKTPVLEKRVFLNQRIGLGQTEIWQVFPAIGQGEENLSDSESDEENRMQIRNDENFGISCYRGTAPNVLPFPDEQSNLTSENDFRTSILHCSEDAREQLNEDPARDQVAELKDNRKPTSNLRAAVNIGTSGMHSHESGSKQPKNAGDLNATDDFSEELGTDKPTVGRKFNNDVYTAFVSRQREREHERTGIGDDVSKKNFPKNGSGSDARVHKKDLRKRYPGDDHFEEHAKCPDRKQNNLQEFKDRQQNGRETPNYAQERPLTRYISISEGNNGSHVLPEATYCQASPDTYDRESDMDRSHDLTSRDTRVQRANYGTKARRHGSEEQAAFNSCADGKANVAQELDPRNEYDTRGAEWGTDNYHGGGLRQASPSTQLQNIQLNQSVMLENQGRHVLPRGRRNFDIRGAEGGTDDYYGGGLRQASPSTQFQENIHLSQSVPLENQGRHVPPRGRRDFDTRGAEGGTDDYYGGGLRQASPSTRSRENIHLSQSVTLENQDRHVPPRGRGDFGEYLSLGNMEVLGTRKTVYSGRVTRYIHSRQVDERYYLGRPVCCICNQRIATCILLPCGHSLCCNTCASFQRVCLECGETICDIAEYGVH